MLTADFSLIGALELFVGAFVFGLGFGFARWLIGKVLK